MDNPTLIPVGCKSPLDFILEIYNPQGQDVGFPQDDWVIKLYTNGDEQWARVSYENGKCLNCFNDAGKVHVVILRHNLTPGIIKAEMEVKGRHCEDSHCESTIFPAQIIGIEITSETGTQTPKNLTGRICVPLLGGVPAGVIRFITEDGDSFEVGCINKATDVD